MSSQSIFFTLPLELRESIYSTAIMSHLLDRDEIYKKEYGWQSNYRQLLLLCREEDDIETVISPVLYWLPALFFVSRQIGAEAERVLYLHCTLVWVFPSLSLSKDLEHIPSRHHQFVRSVEYSDSFPCDPSHTLHRQLATLVDLLPNLRNLTINFTFDSNILQLTMDYAPFWKGRDLGTGGVTWDLLALRQGWCGVATHPIPSMPPSGPDCRSAWVLPFARWRQATISQSLTLAQNMLVAVK
ncbi:MAG: hypothetical protein Q9172_003581 [Xanthocarpia lactea]